MSDLPLIFNKETGKWERIPEPYMTLEIATQADFEELKAAVEFYKNRDKYVERKHGLWKIARESEISRNVWCSACGKDFYLRRKGELQIDKMPYCLHCGAKMDKESEETK